MNARLKLTVVPTQADGSAFNKLLNDQFEDIKSKGKKEVPVYETIHRPRFDLRKNGFQIEFFSKNEFQILYALSGQTWRKNPLFSVAEVVTKTGMSAAVIRKALRRFCDSRIMFETYNHRVGAPGTYAYGFVGDRVTEVLSHMRRIDDAGFPSSAHAIVWLINLSLELARPLCSADAPDVFTRHGFVISQHCGSSLGLMEAYHQKNELNRMIYEYHPTKIGISVAKHWNEITELVDGWRQNDVA